VRRMARKSAAPKSSSKIVFKTRNLAKRSERHIQIIQ
jgi:hypothetical protein